MFFNLYVSANTGSHQLRWAGLTERWGLLSHARKVVRWLGFSCTQKMKELFYKQSDTKVNSYLQLSKSLSRSKGEKESLCSWCELPGMKQV